MPLLLHVGLVIGATAVTWKGSEWLETSSEQLAAYYELPPIVQGAVIAAVGSSFPELSSVVLATLVHGEFDLGVSAIVGSAIFNILVIPAVSGFVGGQLASDRELVYKDAQFYITSVAVLLLAFSIAVIYNPVADMELGGVMTRPIALIPILLYGLYLFLHQQDTREYVADQSGEGIAVAKQWTWLGASLAVILIGVEGLVQAAIGLGDYFGTPSFLWGLTVIAAGTSLPDAFVSVRAAQKGEGTVSMANVLGSNIFDLLVAVPVGILIAGATPVDYAVAAPMMGFLTLATIVLFAMMRTRLRLSQVECIALLVLYAVFVGWMVLETAGVTAIVT
jgi:cation:H+ antiporter